MKHILSLLISLSMMLFVFSACAQKELILDEPIHTQTEENTWAQETNEEENVDTSDLDLETDQMQEADKSQKPTEQKLPRIAFPLSEYQQLPKTGKGTIKGMIYVRNSDGEKVIGKNTRLYLNPVTSYSEQWYNESYLDGYKLEKADSRLFNYLRFTASDANGAFAFYGVPSGSYYLIGTVKCGIECGYETPKSIRIAAQVSVHGNQVITRDLSREVD